MNRLNLSESVRTGYNTERVRESRLILVDCLWLDWQKVRFSTWPWAAWLFYTADCRDYCRAWPCFKSDPRADFYKIVTALDPQVAERLCRLDVSKVVPAVGAYLRQEHPTVTVTFSGDWWHIDTISLSDQPIEFNPAMRWPVSFFESNQIARTWAEKYPEAYQRIVRPQEQRAPVSVAKTAPAKTNKGTKAKRAKKTAPVTESHTKVSASQTEIPLVPAPPSLPASASAVTVTQTVPPTTDSTAEPSAMPVNQDFLAMKATLPVSPDCLTQKPDREMEELIRKGIEKTRHWQEYGETAFVPASSDGITDADPVQEERSGEDQSEGTEAEGSDGSSDETQESDFSGDDDLWPLLSDSPGEIQVLQEPETPKLDLRVILDWPPKQ